MKLDDQETPPWLGIFELFSEPDSDAIDRSMEYQSRYRRELRHGPHGRDRFLCFVVLIFYSGMPGETRLDMNLPGMEEVGTWFGPHAVDVSGKDAIAHTDAIAQNTLSPWSAVWLR